MKPENLIKLIYFSLVCLNIFSVVWFFSMIDLSLIDDYRSFKKLSEYSLESSYMKPYADEKIEKIIKNLLISFGVLLTDLLISVNLLLKVYNMKKDVEPSNSGNLRIENRAYYEGRIRGLSEILGLMEQHGNNINMYGHKLIEFLDSLDFPNVVVHNDRILEYVKNEFDDDIVRLDEFMRNIDSSNEYHLISKDTGNISPLTLDSITFMLNDILYEYDKDKNEVKK